VGHVKDSNQQILKKWSTVSRKCRGQQTRRQVHQMKGRRQVAKRKIDKQKKKTISEKQS
jgi:hypothetical protein